MLDRRLLQEEKIKNGIDHTLSLSQNMVYYVAAEFRLNEAAYSLEKGNKAICHTVYGNIAILYTINCINT